MGRLGRSLPTLNLIKTEPLSQVPGKTPTTWSQPSTYPGPVGVRDAEQGMPPSSEQSPLLGARASCDDDLDNTRSKPEGKITAVVWTVLAGVFVVGLILVFAFQAKDWDDPFQSPEKILKSAPVIDGHIGKFIPRAHDPQHLGLSRGYLRAYNQTCPNSFGYAMRTTCLHLISMSRCRDTLTYQG